MTVQSPADRPPGDRGARGLLAASLVVGATLALGLVRLRSQSSGNADIGGWQIAYSYQSPAWSTVGLVAAAAALAAAGTSLWVARRGRLVALAAVAALAGVGILAWTIATPNDIRVSSATYRSIGLGMTQAQVTGRLGAPFSNQASAARHGGGASIGCLLYRAAPGPAAGIPPIPGYLPRAVITPGAPGYVAPPDVTGVDASTYLFCFEHGLLRVKSAI
jgi:hypothetical protein